MQNHLQIIAGIIGFVTYCFLFFKILKSKAEQNFAAFLVWAMLSIITTTTVFIEEGNYWLSLGNVLGETAITILLLVKKQIIQSPYNINMNRNKFLKQAGASYDFLIAF